MTQLSKPSPLGRGLSALFGDVDAAYAPPPPMAVIRPPAPSAGDIAASRPNSGVHNVPVTYLMPGRFQPRRYFDEAALAELAQSIKERGILEPIIVRLMDTPKGDQSMEIVAGERRWRAAQLAGVHTVPVIVKNLADKEAAEYAIIENVQRENLSPLEEAEAYQRLLSEFHYSHEKLATNLGKSRAHISNMLRILALPEAIKKMVDKGELTMGHARALITTRDPVAMAAIVVKKGLSVRQTEDLAKTDSVKESAPRAKSALQENDDVLALERELQRVIGLRVKVTTKGKAGSLTLFYNDLDQLDDIIKKLRG